MGIQSSRRRFNSPTPTRWRVNRVETSASWSSIQYNLLEDRHIEKFRSERVKVKKTFIHYEILKKFVGRKQNCIFTKYLLRFSMFELALASWTVGDLTVIQPMNIKEHFRLFLKLWCFLGSKGNCILFLLSYSSTKVVLYQWLLTLSE